MPWSIPSNGEIQKLLAERMQHNGVGTVIGVIDPAGRRVIVWGRSGAANDRPLDGDTVFQLGSLTKVFTGLLLAEMVGRGEVALDDPAQKYLPPGIVLPVRGRPITLLDLATHRSGLPSMPTNFRLEAEPNPIEAYTPEELWQFLSSYELPREPGEKYEYSNLGVSLLGRLLAQRAGRQYEVLLKERVLTPLGMDSTAITVTAGMSARLAPGHSPYLQPVDSWEMKTLNASGSVRSTANDLLKLLAAYLGLQESPLQDAMLLQRTTRYPVNGTTAIAWGASSVGSDEVYMHEGGKAGYRSAAVFNPATRAGIVVLQNARTEDRPTALALHLLTGRALPPTPAAPAPKNSVKLSHRSLAHFAGRYRVGPDELLTVVAKRDHLLIGYRPGHEGFEFFPSGARDFFYNTGNDDITFVVDSRGNATGLRLYDDGRAAGHFRTGLRE